MASPSVRTPRPAITTLSFSGTCCTSVALCDAGLRGVRAKARNETMAGRYQGYHYLPNNSKSVEIFWRADGWWWWPRVTGHPPDGAPIGPFLTSTEAYLSASGGGLLIPRPTPYKAPLH